MPLTHRERIAKVMIMVPFNISQKVYGGNIGSFNSIIVTLLAFVIDRSPPLLSIKIVLTID